MTTHATTWWGVLSSAVSALSIGYAVVPNASGRFVVATAANRASFGRAWGVAITAASDQNPSFEYQVASVLSADDSDIGTGTAGDWVIVAADGSLERKATPTAGDDVIGRCPHTTGDVQIMPGVWDSENTSPGGGAASTGSAGAVQTSDGSGGFEDVPAVFNGFAVIGGTTFGVVATGGTAGSEWVTLGTDAAGLAANTFKTVYNQARNLISWELTDGGYATLFYNAGDPIFYLQGGVDLAIGTSPASLGSVRLPQDGSIWIKNEAGDDDLRVFVKGNLDVLVYGSGASDTWIDSGTGGETIVLADSHRIMAGNGGADFITASSSSVTVASGASTFTVKPVAAVADGNARCKVYSNIASVQTTDATATTIYSWTPTDEAVTMVTAEVTAVTSTGAAGATYIRRARIKRDGGTVTVATPVDVGTDEDGFNGDVTIDNSGTTARIRVTGVAATTADWGCVVTRMEVTHA